LSCDELRPGTSAASGEEAAGEEDEASGEDKEGSGLSWLPAKAEERNNKHKKNAAKKAGGRREDLIAGRLFTNFENCRRHAKHDSPHIRREDGRRKLRP
jgi:hypothetical protein